MSGGAGLADSTADAQERWTGPYSAAVALDRKLGDPTDPANPHGYAAMVRRAEGGTRPEALVEIAGPCLRLSYVPRSYGGTLTGLDETVALVRVAARRDLTIMPTTMIDITATSCLLLAGAREQIDWAVDIVGSGGSIGFAFSEPEHGSDLLANDSELITDGDGWLLNGHKWMVGFGGDPRAALVIARTGGRGPAAFSCVLLDDCLSRSEVRWELQRPGGMRGARFVRMTFDRAKVPSAAMVGRVGRGMETAMRAMHVVRVVSAGANLAAVDTALRLALDFAGTHEVAGRAVEEYPINRCELGTAAAAMFASDAVAMACARGMHTMPATMGLWSGVVKFVVTDLAAEAFDRCADVLGTRSVLREGPTAAFDVLRADNTAVRYFDTSPTANLRLVSMQLTGIAHGRTGAWPSDRLARTFVLGAVLPEFDPGAIGLSSRGADEVIGGLAVAAEGARVVLSGTEPETVELIDRLETTVGELCEAIEQVARTAGPEAAMQRLELAEKACYLYAAGACVLLWWFNRDRALYGTPRESTEWLRPALALLLARAAHGNERLSLSDADSALGVLSRLHASDRLFSAVPIPLSGTAKGD